MVARHGVLLLAALTLGSAAPDAGQRPGTEVAEQAAAAPRRLKVWFLGDRGHHQPAARAAEVHAPLAARGVDLFYREDLDLLQPGALEAADALVVYANHDLLGADGRGSERAAALLEWVRGGGALVAVHCASFCFRDREEYVGLVGGQFLRHGTGTFRTEVVDGEHPIAQGYDGFESWDETYVHHLLADDRRVLEQRPPQGDEAGPEDWTWTREEGEGRVFYTAWGHDSRTWTHAGFQDLLVRGIRWATGDDAPGRAWRKDAFTYREARVPNYQPAGQGQVHDSMQEPLEPAASAQHHVVPPGMRLELFATEPLVTKAIAQCWDERGRLWVAETVDYPNDRKDSGGGDRIVILEDADGDGRADLRTVYAEGLSVPTSLVHGPDGLIVSQAPSMLLLPDRDGDDRADERIELFRGWGTGDTHAGPSNLRYGFDGWIWGTVGYAGFNGEVGGVRHRFGSGIYRFRPDGSALESLRATTNNTWGLGLSEEGLVFGSTANGNASVHLGIPNRVYERLRGWSPGPLQTIAETQRFHPVTEGVRQVDFHGQYTAGAGHALYTARAFPERYWNRAAFVSGPTGHLVGQLFLEPDGSHFRARDGWSLFASRDEWCAPISAEVGPDGCVWILDWYNYIVQHNPTPRGFDNGPGNAYVTPLRDKTHGRIWRVVPESGTTAAPPLADLGQRVAALEDGNLFWRLSAQRLLASEPGAERDAALLRMLAEPRIDAVGLVPGALHAAHLLLGEGGAREAARLEADRLLRLHARGPHAVLRRLACELLPRDAALTDLVLAGRLLDDAAPRVRLAALLALAETPGDDRVGVELERLLREPSFLEDRWLPEAALAAAAQHAAGFLTAVLRGTRRDELELREERAPRNLLANGSIEAVDGERPVGWSPRTYGGQAEHFLAPGRNGGHALGIRSASGSDTSWFAPARLEPGGRYRLSAWVRTAADFDRHTGRGVQLNVHEVQGTEDTRTEGLGPGTGWRQVVTEFTADGRADVTINALFGGWGFAKGEAWFDDLVLEPLAPPVLGGELGRVVTRVTNHEAEFGDPAERVELLEALPDAVPELARAILEGFVASARSQGPALDAPGLRRLERVHAGLDGPCRVLLTRLVLGWGAGPAFAQQAEASRAWLVDELRRLDLAPAEAGFAARELLLLGEAVAVPLLLEALDLDTAPDVAATVLAALGEASGDDVGRALLRRLEALAPGARLVAVQLLTRRAAWTTALLDAIEAEALPVSALPATSWQALQQSPNEVLAERALALGPGARGDGAALVARYQGALDLEGRPELGHALYEEHCAVCHRFGGQGGEVGPALDGIGATSGEELLVHVLDPSRNVEANYQLWTAVTFDGVIHAGRLLGETRTTLELIDAQARTTTLEKEEVEVLSPSPVSLMPSGFESLGEQGLADLFAFLRSQEDHR